MGTLAATTTAYVRWLCPFTWGRGLYCVAKPWLICYRDLRDVWMMRALSTRDRALKFYCLLIMAASIIERLLANTWYNRLRHHCSRVPRNLVNLTMEFKLEITSCKVHIVQEGHKKLIKSSPLIWHLLHNVKSTGKIWSNFVALLENINFIYQMLKSCT